MISLLGRSFRVVVVVATVTVAVGSMNSFAERSTTAHVDGNNTPTRNRVQVFRILGLLELCIDTFEYPGPPTKEGANCGLLPLVLLPVPLPCCYRYCYRYRRHGSPIKEGAKSGLLLLVLLVPFTLPFPLLLPISSPFYVTVTVSVTVSYH